MTTQLYSHLRGDIASGRMVVLSALRASYAYDAATGRRTAVINALGEATHYHYSVEGQLLAPSTPGRASSGRS